MEHVSEDAKRSFAYLRKSSLNVRTSSTALEHFKRRDSTTADDLALNTTKFSAVTLSNAPNQRQFGFVSVSTVLRAHIPLSWLSSSNLHSPQPGSLLRAEIPAISRWDYQILVAKLCPGNVLYAFERVDVDTYLCHPLHPWVKPYWVEQAAVGAAPLVSLDLLLKSQCENSHSRKHSTTSVTGVTDFALTATSPKVSQNRKGQLARLSILDARNRGEDFQDVAEVQNDTPNRLQFEQAILDTPETETVPEDLEAVSLALSRTACQTPRASTPDGKANLDTEVEKTADVVDHLSTEHLRRQYLETLYCSKTSLAFYAKGPLSRARARARDPSTSRSSKDLVEFYLESIVSTKKLDLKYRESIDTEITRLALVDGDDLNRQTHTSRKKKQAKLGKNGLWPVEVEYIERWWKSQHVVNTSLPTMTRLAEEKKRLIAQLRMRETEMQILTILEVLALEARDIPIPPPPNGHPVLSGIKIESIEKDGPSIPPNVPTTKKKRNLKSELDILVDRLCIWHSIGAEDTAAPQDEPSTSSVPFDKRKDRLRDFCKDAIVPFYGAKLPDECHSICIKMGGPELSPRRSKKVVPKESTRLVPGSVLVQERPTKKRDLHRVLSEDQGSRHFSPPAISRSATLPAAVSGKREASERPMSRSGMHKSVSFSNREVDLVADARVTAAKRRKLDLVAAQKRELDAAIETLKKPNRSAVARGIADEAERRSLDNGATMKRVEPVQITATPRRGTARRTRTDDYDLPTLPASIAFQEETFIPSSTSKPRGLIHTMSNISRSSAKKRAVLSAIHDTPSRAMIDQTTQSRELGGSPPDDLAVPDGGSSSTLVASTPTTSRVRTDVHAESVAVTPMRMGRSLRPVALTPLKRPEVRIEDVFKDAPEIPERAGKMMDRVMGSKTDPEAVSLYDSLGWNDDYEL